MVELVNMNYGDAIYQFRTDRDPKTRLFRFKAGVLVSFAMDLEQVYGNVKKCAVGKYPKSEKLGSTGQAACCACAHSRYFAGGSPSGLRV